MDRRVQQFRRMAAALGAGEVGVRYGAELRQLAASYAAEQVRSGSPLAGLAQELGVGLATLQR